MAKKWRLAGALTLLLALLCLPAAASAEERPVVTVADFTPRVTKSEITMTDVNVPFKAILGEARNVFMAELAGSPQFVLKNFDEIAMRARVDEASLMNDLGDGRTNPVLAADADYVVFGYLVTLGTVKAQSGALLLSGSNKTVYTEISLRVMDTHTGAIVYMATADSRRKSELRYHAIVNRADTDATEDAIRQSVEDTAVNLAAQILAAM